MSLEETGAIASVVGALIGIPALLIALMQLWRTKRAAEAAAASAAEAVRRLSGVIAVASLEQICSRSRDLMHLMRAKNFTASATVAFELRESLARFCKSRAAAQLTNEDEWSKILKSTSQVHDSLEGAASIRKIDAGEREQMLQQVAEIHSQLSILAALAAERVGG